MSTQVLKPASTKYAADHYDEFTNKRPTPYCTPPAWALTGAGREVTAEYEASEEQHRLVIAHRDEDDHHAPKPRADRRTPVLK